MKLRSKLSKIVNIIVSLLLFLSLIYLSYSIILYKGIETFYRIMFIIIGIYINLALIFSLHFSNRKMKKKRHTITLIFSVIFIIAYTLLSIIIKNVLYDKLSSMNKSSITHTTKLISLDNDYDIKNLKDKKIGLLNQKEDIEYYILPNEVIKEYKLSSDNKIINYTDALELINALYEKEVDLIFVPKSYIDIYPTFDEYNDILDRAKEIYTYEKEYKKEEVETSENQVAKLTKPFTVLLLGIDSTDPTLSKNASFNGDTMILASFNPKTMSATMTSFPRDTFVPVSCAGGRMQRINTSAWCGTNGAITTVENLTGIDINYYVKINFKGLVKLVDALGGIDVNVPYSFCEQNSSRKWGKNTVFVEKGKQHLNGEQALALARNRHTPNDGSNIGRIMAKYCPDYNEGNRSDFTRNTNQQLVIKGILNAAKNISSLSEVNKILDTISKNIDTNMKVEQMLSGYDLIKSLAVNKNANTLNIQKTKLKTYSIGKSGHMIYEPSTKSYASVAFYYKQSLQDIIDAIKINLGKKKGTLIKKFSFNLNEPYKETIIGNGSYNESKYTLIPNFSNYSVNKLKEFANKNNLELNFIDSQTNEKLELSSFTDYTFMYQKEKEYTPVFRIESINIYVKSNIQAPIEQPTVPEEDTQNNLDNSTSDNENNQANNELENENQETTDSQNE